MRLLRSASQYRQGAVPLLAMAFAATLAAPAYAAPSFECSSGSASMCKDTTAGGMVWTVPAGVSRATFIADGAQGGPSYVYLSEKYPTPPTIIHPGGYGGEASAVFNVTPGQVFYFAVGEMGTGPVSEENDGGGILVESCLSPPSDSHPQGAWVNTAEAGCGGGGSFVATKLGNDPYPRIMLAAGGGGGAGGGAVGGAGGGIPEESGSALNGQGSGGGFGAEDDAPGKGGESQGGGANPQYQAGSEGYPAPTLFDSNGFEFSAGGSGGGGGYNTFPDGSYFYGGGSGGSGYYGGGGGSGCSEKEPGCGAGGGGGGGGSAYADPSATLAPTGFDGGATGGGNGSIEVIYENSNSKQSPGSGSGPSSGGGAGSGSGGGGGGGNASQAACIVPKLKGVKLSAAAKKLSAADCKLGKVKGKKSKSAKVTKQSPAAGKTLPAGAKVGVTVQ